MFRYRKHIWLVMLLAIGTAVSLPATGDEKADHGTESHEAVEAVEDASVEQDADREKDEEDEEDESEEKLIRTQHSVTIDGTELEYSATAGTLTLKEDGGDAKANFFFIAYTKDGVEDLTGRPVTFSFNGGPGSSSVWLHLGVLGPRRVLLKDDGTAPPPPSRVVDNEFSILDRTDLVFIDPVATGFSRAAEGEDPHQFHGVQEDIESVGEFIRLYTTRHKRWASPKFLVGESYGTTRAAGLAGHMHDRHGMYMNGVVLVSAVLNFQTIRFSRGNELPYVLFLPSYTATAWYHKRLPDELLDKELGDVLVEARAFAEGDYALALAKGDALSGAEKQRTAERLARYTGLSLDYVLRANLRIRMNRFAKELLRDQGKTIGRFDSRYLGIDHDDAGESYDYDPSYSAVQGPFTASLNHYIRAELEYESDLPYEILTGRVHPWNYGDFANRYVNVADTLREAMTKNPYLKVMVANGFYDLATPYFATEYTFSHLGLDESLQDHVTMSYYDAGHMMYVHKPSLAKLKEDLARFYDDVLADK